MLEPPQPGQRRVSRQRNRKGRIEGLRSLADDMFFISDNETMTEFLPGV